MEGTEVRIRLTMPGPGAELRVMTADAEPVAARIAHALRALGVRFTQLYTVDTETRQIVHARLAESAGGGLTATRAMSVVESLQAELRSAQSERFCA